MQKNAINAVSVKLNNAKELQKWLDCKAALYTKDIAKKIEAHDGYLTKHGTLLHFAKGTKKPTQKTRDRNSYQGTNNWSHKDLARLQNMEDNLQEYNNR